MKEVKVQVLARAAAYVVNKDKQIYCTELLILVPKKTMDVPVCHLAIASGKMYYMKFKEDVGSHGEVLKVMD